MGLKSKLTGTGAEHIVLSDLHKKGFKCRIIETKSSVRGGRKVYTGSQGCDIMGTTPNGQSVYVEVKAYSGKSIPVSENRGLKLSQIAYLLEMERLNTITFIAIVTKMNIYYIKPSKFMSRIYREKRVSYPICTAYQDATLFASSGYKIK